MAKCPDCKGEMPCENDCAELRYIYLERQKEIQKELTPEPGHCYLCDKRLPDAHSTDLCYSCKEEIAWERLCSYTDDEEG
jgi:hypothetical protein